MGWYLCIQGRSFSQSQSSLQMPSPMDLERLLFTSLPGLSPDSGADKINCHTGLDASGHVLYRQTALILGLAIVPTRWLP